MSPMKCTSAKCIFAARYIFNLTGVVLKSRLFVAIAISLIVILGLSRFMSNTFFHCFKTFDDITGKLASDDMNKFIIQQNYKRAASARWQLKEFTNSSDKSAYVERLKPGPNKDLLITIITIDRVQISSSMRPEYFTQTVAKLLKEVKLYYENDKNGQKLSIEIQFCAVDLLPNINYEVNDAERLTSFQTLRRFESGHPAPPGYMQLTNRFEREKEDYIYCMNSSFHHSVHQGKNPRYLLLLEDDAPPVDNYFFTIENLIRNQLDSRQYGSDRASHRTQYLYVKLFHPENLLEFHALSAERVPQLIALSILSTLIAAVGLTTFDLKRMTQFFIYFVIIILAIGRPNIVFHYQNFLLQQFGFITLVPAPSCCTPAIMYPDSSIPSIVNYMDNVQCHEKYAKDGALDDFKATSNQPAWLVQPNLHRHVGHYSVVRRRDNYNYRQFLVS